MLTPSQELRESSLNALCMQYEGGPTFCICSNDLSVCTPELPLCLASAADPYVTHCVAAGTPSLPVCAPLLLLRVESPCAELSASPLRQTVCVQACASCDMTHAVRKILHVPPSVKEVLRPCSASHHHKCLPALLTKR